MDASPKITQTVTKHIKRSSMSLAIRKIQVKTTVRYLFISIILTIIQTNKEKITNIGKGVENWNCSALQ